MSMEITVPELGEGVTGGSIIAVHIAQGDEIEFGQVLIEIETDKVVVEVPASHSGRVSEICLAEGDLASPGDAIVRLMASDTVLDTNLEVVTPEFEPEPVEIMPATEILPVQAETDTPLAREAFKPPAVRIPAGPSVRRLARELGIDISTVKGHGTRGRITKADVKQHAKKALESGPEAGKTTITPLPDLSVYGPVKRQPLSTLAQATATNMCAAWQRIPHAWLQEKFDITELEVQRKSHKQAVRENGGSLTLTALLTLAIARTLSLFPLFNSAFDESCNELVLRDYIDIGIAVDTPHGLVVPKIRAADDKGLTEISVALNDISERARNRKLTMEDMSGAGITLSNLGGMGLSGMLPIVNWPQVAIIGVAASILEPRYQEGNWEPRLMMPVTLGFDHRVINGADGARFLQHLKSLLEQPFSLLL